MPTTWSTLSQRHNSRYPQGNSMDIYQSSDISSDEDDEYVRRTTKVRSVHRRRTPEKIFNRKIEATRNPISADAYQDNTNVPYNSSARIARFQRESTSVNEPLSSSQPDESSEVYVTTMDENDQQMFIALFYWRRKAIEAHFSAWKWVVFTLRQSAKQIHRHRMKTRPSKPISNDFIGLRPPRRHLILKRHTGLSSAEDSCKSESVADYEKPVLQNRRGNDVKGSDDKGSTASNNALIDDEHSAEKRRQFRAELRLVYSCFRLWKSNVDVSKKRRLQQFVQATDFHRMQQLRTALRAWKCGNRIYKLKRKHQDDADKFHWNRVKRDVFHEWTRYCRVEREITRRQTINASQQKRGAFQHWYQCILQTRKCQNFAAKRCHNHLHFMFRSFRRGVVQAQGERLKYAAATSHDQDKLQLSILRLWREAVFEDPLYMLSIDHGTRLSLASGVRKWRRFMAEKEQRSHKVLLADFFHYRASLRRGLRGLGHFLQWKRQRIQVFDDVRMHYERNLKLNGIRKFRTNIYVNQTLRSKVRMATRWSQRKLLSKVLEVWVTNARKYARLGEVRHAVHTKMLNRAVHLWRTQAVASKSLRAKQGILSKRCNELLLKTYMEKWVRMAQLHYFISSLTLKRRNMCMMNHFRYWHAWSEQKVRWRNVVEQHRVRSDKYLLQHVVNKWFGVTLRKRCCTRLVKLFRKKQSRNRVKFIFRLLQVHALVSIATHKRDLDRARLSLLEWKHICRDRKEKRMFMTVATQYYCERRYAMAVGLWCSFARRSTRSRKAEGNALSHYFRGLLVTSLQHWYIAARKLRRQEEFLNYCQQVRENQAKTHCLHAWYIIVRQRIHHRAQEWSALQFQIENLRRRSFYAWLQFLETRRASDEKVYFAISSYENYLQGKVLQAWHLSTRRRVQLKRKCTSMQNSLKQRRLRSSITRWSIFCFERRRHRNQIAVAEKFYNEYLLCLTMYHWQDMWSQVSILRHKQASAARQVKSLRLAKTVSKWHRNYQHSSMIRAKKTKASRFYMTKVLEKHFGLWKRNQEAVRHKVSKWRFVSRLRQQKLLVRMFQRWQHFSEINAFERVQTKEAVQHRASFVLRLTYQGWKRYRSKRSLYIIAYTYRRRTLLQKMWFDWKLHREYVVKVRQNMLVTSQFLRNNLFRATFLRWKAYISQRRTRLNNLYRADDHYNRLFCKRAVARLRKQARFQQAVERAATFGRINGARFIWRKWRHVVAVKRRKRSRRMLAEQTHFRNHNKRHFCAWRTFTKRCVQGRRNKSDALYRVSCLRMVWSRWNRAVSWRKCITAMGYRRLDHLQVAILQKWRTHTRNQIKLKALTTKAIVFQKTKLRSKVWKSWLRYINHCHDKQQQLVWVLSYYSVEVLLRRSLASWRVLVAIKKMQREHNALAASFNSHRIIREGYRKWREYVELRRQKHERIEALLLQSEMLMLSRSMRKWGSRAVNWRRQHRNEALAARFYSRRRLNYGLDKLLKWRASQMITRELVGQAKRFRDDKTIAACFQCWQRYHQWRAKYAHLAHVFKQNQKGDVFARWKSYWRERQSINEKRLQARVFHCVRMEQNVLATWRTFVRAKKQMKVAIAFNITKVLRETFRFWKRRVHVLRQMRKMLLYQESFRAQTHFDAWKRFMVARKQMSERLRKAMRLKDKLRRLDVWQKWSAWVSMQQQTRATIELAVGFRERFFTRKTFAVWKRRAINWNRQRVLRDQALLQYKSALLYRGFRLLVDWRQSNMRLTQLQCKLSTRLVERCKRRAIAKLRALCAESNRKRSLIKSACSHWQVCHQQKYWGRIMQWFNVAKYRKLQRIQADTFARTHLLRRWIRALQVHICHTKQVKAKIEAFRCRYFRSVADDCFYQWWSFTTFKLKLHDLRRKALQSQRRQRLQQWRRIAVEQVRRRAGMHQIAVKRRRRELITCFNHWESVCTDQWIDKELVAHHQRYAQKQRMLRSALNTLKSQLPVRHERQKCKSFFLQHHRAFLIQVMHHWRQTTSTCDV